MLIRKMGGYGSCHGNVAMYIRKQRKHRIKIRRGGKWSAKVKRCNRSRHLGTKKHRDGVEHGGHGGDMGGEGGRGVEVETSTHTTHSHPKAPQNLGYWTLAAPKTLQLHYLENFESNLPAGTVRKANSHRMGKYINPNDPGFDHLEGVQQVPGRNFSKDFKF